MTKTQRLTGLREGRGFKFLHRHFASVAQPGTAQITIDFSNVSVCLEIGKYQRACFLTDIPVQIRALALQEIKSPKR